jgi:hypothetical protein
MKGSVNIAGRDYYSSFVARIVLACRRERGRRVREGST